MKRIFLIFVLFSGIVFGQFTVSSNHWEELGRYFEGVKLYENSDKTKAKISYLDYNTIGNNTSVLNQSNDYEFIFTTEINTLDKLYKLIIEKLQEKKKQEIILNFPEGILILDFYAVNFVSFKFENKDSKENLKRSTVGLNINRISKLFGKK